MDLHQALIEAQQYALRDVEELTAAEKAAIVLGGAVYELLPLAERARDVRDLWSPHPDGTVARAVRYILSGQL